ncbi:MAG: hypothetical protein KC978_19920 [Candidatus Omnitrophica bacterium]|nr:hypothetical protein [Candidatus Omnitrophota bacterium]
MNSTRTQKDLVLLKNGSFRLATWTFDPFGRPDLFKIFGAFRLNPARFNLSDLNLLVPVPSNLYDEDGRGKFHFYQYVYIDEALRIRNAPNAPYRSISRGHRTNPYARAGFPNMRGWQWICVMHPTCGPNENILDLIASVQSYLNTDA